MISRIHLILPNAYKLMCFDRNINGNRDVKFLECDYLVVQGSVKLTLIVMTEYTFGTCFYALPIKKMGFKSHL